MEWLVSIPSLAAIIAMAACSGIRRRDRYIPFVVQAAKQEQDVQEQDVQSEADCPLGSKV
jgi:hypothetical protein